MIIALVFIVVALVCYFDFLVPAYTALQVAEGNKISEQNLLANETQIVSQFQGLLASYQSDASGEQAVNAALPVGPHLADAIAQLYGIANANNMTIVSMSIGSQLTPPPAAANGVSGAAASGQIINPIGTVTFDLGILGSYENFKNFLAELATNMRLFDVKKFSFQASGATNSKTTSADFFDFDVSAQTYYQSQSQAQSQ